MKTKFYLLVTTLLLHAGIALGDIYTDPATNVNYEYKSSTNIAIVKSGEKTSAGSPNAKANVEILSEFTIDGKNYKVKEIGEHAFYNCSQISSLTIPEGIEKIYSEAFYGCRINTLNLPTSITKLTDAFKGCNGINNVNTSDIKWILQVKQYNTNTYSSFLSKVDKLYINGKEVNDLLIEDVYTIEDYAFCGFKGLRTIKIGGSVKNIGQWAFHSCPNLTTVEIENSVSTIGMSAFVSCKKLTTLTLGNDLKNIGRYAFQNCSNLMSVTIPMSVESIEVDAFKDTGIYNSQSDGVYYVDNWACGYKGEATEDGEFFVKEGTIGISAIANVGYISIPVSVKHIPYDIRHLTNLKKLYIDGQNNLDALNLTDYPKSEKLTTVILGNEITTIKENKFNGLKKLKTVIMGYGLRKIGYSAFSGCESLEKVRIPNGVTTIDGEAFWNCINMTTLTIPNSVTTFGPNVFQNCIGLVSVNALMNVPIVINENVFSCSSNGYDSRTIYYIATLYVPRGRTAIYQNVSAWKLFSNIQEKDVAYELTYILDGEVYKSMEIQPGITITPEANPVKDGMVFSGWRTVPAEMPDHDVVVYGWFEPYTSGIGELSQDKKPNGVDTWYTISGLRLPSKPFKAGIYIHRGKKVIIR